MRIPNIQSKKWRVSYIGKFFGDIIQAFNLDLFSDKGRIKTGDKIYPHTVQADIASLETIKDFTKAKISDGTAREEKLWGVSNKIIASDGGTFEVITETGIADDEAIGTNSDIISVEDTSEEGLEVVPVSITGTEYIFNLGELSTNKKIAQSFESIGPLKKIVLDLYKVGEPTDNLEISIQGDSSGEPDGVDKTSTTVWGAGLSTTVESHDIEFDDDLIFETGTTYWLVITRSGSADNLNHYKLKAIVGSDSDDDPYEDGKLRLWNGSNWYDFQTDAYGYPLKYLSSTNTEYTVGGDGELFGETWTPAEINGSGFGVSKVYGSDNTSPNTTYYIDYIRIKVYYTDGGTAYETDALFPSDFSTWGAGDPWTNPANAKTKDGTYATAEQGTEKEQNWYDFGFSVPGTATITGIKVYISGKTDLPDNDVYIISQLSKTAGSNIGNPMAFGVKPPHDLKMDVYTEYPQAGERIYMTTSKDVLFLGAEDDKWYSLWRGILERDDLESYPVVLKNLGAAGTLYLGNNNLLHTFTATAISPSDGTFNKLIFDSKYYINWISVTSSAMFIGLCNKLGEDEPSKVVHFQPYAKRTRIFTIKEGATIGFVQNENCHIIDKMGQIRAFSGTTFKPYTYFPCYYRDELMETLPHRNGIIVRGDIVKIAWKGQYPDPAGIWVIEDGNLYHKHSLVFNKTVFNSLGAIEVDEIGALYEDTDIYIGASVIDGVEAEIEGVYSSVETNVASDNRAHFITPKLISQGISEIWQDIVVKYDPETDGDIKVKYKVEPNKVSETAEYSGTWTSSTTFTCDTATFITAVNNDNIEVGDEVIVRKGQGAGLLAHITEISGTTTKTVTIDEGLTAISNGKFTFSVEKWKKVNMTLNNDKFSAKASLKDEKLESTQLKVEIDKHTLEEIQVSNTTNYKI